MNSDIERRLTMRGIALTEQKLPRYHYVPFTRAGDIVYLSGKTAMQDGAVRYTGRLGAELGLEDGKEAARLCAINLLSTIEQSMGLENVRAVLKLTGFVASTPEFFDQAVVDDAASELITDVLGEGGEHARSALGLAALPGNPAVEVELIIRTMVTV